jgi:hypothetical protein
LGELVFDRALIWRSPLAGLLASTRGLSGDTEADDEPFTPQLCIANIGPRQRRQRLLFGVQAFVGALVVLAALLFFHVAVGWRLVLFVPFYLATVGYFQARDRT